MSSEKPTPERIVVDFPKTEIADEKTRRSVLRLALPLVLLPHVAQEFWLHSLLQRRQYRGRPKRVDHPDLRGCGTRKKARKNPGPSSFPVEGGISSPYRPCHPFHRQA